MVLVFTFCIYCFRSKMEVNEDMMIRVEAAEEFVVEEIRSLRQNFKDLENRIEETLNSAVTDMTNSIEKKVLERQSEVIKELKLEIEKRDKKFGEKIQSIDQKLKSMKNELEKSEQECVKKVASEVEESVMKLAKSVDSELSKQRDIIKKDLSQEVNTIIASHPCGFVSRDTPGHQEPGFMEVSDDGYLDAETGTLTCPPPPKHESTPKPSISKKVLHGQHSNTSSPSNINITSTSKLDVNEEVPVESIESKSSSCTSLPSYFKHMPKNAESDKTGNASKTKGHRSAFNFNWTSSKTPLSDKVAGCPDEASPDFEVDSCRRSSSPFITGISKVEQIESDGDDHSLPSDVAPKKMADIDNSDLQDYISPKLDQREKMTQMQLALVSSHVSRFANMPLEKMAMAIIADGQRRGLWQRGFKPHGVTTTFLAYLKEKVKGMKKKDRVKRLHNMV